MKTLTQIKTHLNSLESTFGFNPANVNQDDEEWLVMKLGVLSATGGDALLAGPTTAKRKGYLAGKVAEVCTGMKPQITSKQMSWGLEHESAARSIYEFDRDTILHELPMIFKDDSLRYACSPDGITDKFKGAEIKCPYTTQVFIEFLSNGIIKPEYKKQCQFSMWITGYEIWDFMNYDKRMNSKPYHIVPIERDLKMMKSFDDAVPQAVFEMDKMLKDIGIKFGDHWETLKKGRE